MEVGRWRMDWTKTWYRTIETSKPVAVRFTIMIDGKMEDKIIWDNIGTGMDCSSYEACCQFQFSYRGNAFPEAQAVVSSKDAGLWIWIRIWIRIRMVRINLS
jgi:hypothetical protein